MPTSWILSIVAIFLAVGYGLIVWQRERLKSAEVFLGEVKAELKKVTWPGRREVVNTTSVGLRSDVSPVPADALRAESTVLDAVYDPPRTRLLRDAEARGARIVSGKWMLVEQAVEQIRLWSGKTPPAEVMAQAFDDAAPQG